MTTLQIPKYLLGHGDLGFSLFFSKIVGISSLKHAYSGIEGKIKLGANLDYKEDLREKATV